MKKLFFVRVVGVVSGCKKKRRIFTTEGTTEGTEDTEGI